MVPKRKCGIAVMVITLILAMSVAYAQPNDIRGHWAEAQILDWSNKGLASGYEDGSFRPDAPITRAEFVALFNRVFQLTDAKPQPFADVKATDWFAGEVAVAKTAAYIGGYEDGTFRPNQPITREEVASVLTRYFKLASTEQLSQLQKFKDSVSDWSRFAVDAAVARGLLGGYEDQTFRAAQPITRAETIVVLDRAKAMVTPISQTIVYDRAGTYGPATGMTTIQGDVVIAVADVTLRNTTITGNLTLGEGIGEGNATLKNVIVKGQTFVNGGGAHSIVFENFQGDDVISAKPGVRIVVTGSTKVQNLRLENGAIIAEVDLDGDGISDVTLSEKMPAGSTVELSGEFEKVKVDSADTAVSLSEQARVANVEINSAATITGAGRVESAQVNSSAPVTLGAKFDNVEVTAPKAAVEVKGSVNSMTVADTAAGTSVKVAENAVIRDNLTIKAAAEVKVDPKAAVGKVDVVPTQAGAVVKVEGSTIALVDITSAAQVVIPDGSRASIVVNAAGATLDVAKTAQVAVDAKANTVTMTGDGKDKVAKVDLTALVQSVAQKEAANQAADAAAKAQEEAQKALAKAQDEAAKAAAEKAAAAAKAAADKAAADKAAAEKAAADAKAAADKAAELANPTTPTTPPAGGGGGGGGVTPTTPAPKIATLTYFEVVDSNKTLKLTGTIDSLANVQITVTSASNANTVQMDVAGSTVGSWTLAGKEGRLSPSGINLSNALLAFMNAGLSQSDLISSVDFSALFSALTQASDADKQALYDTLPLVVSQLSSTAKADIFASLDVPALIAAASDVDKAEIKGALDAAVAVYNAKLGTSLTSGDMVNDLVTVLSNVTSFQDEFFGAINFTRIFNVLKDSPAIRGAVNEQAIIQQVLDHTNQATLAGIAFLVYGDIQGFQPATRDAIFTSIDFGQIINILTTKQKSVTLTVKDTTNNLSSPAYKMVK